MFTVYRDRHVCWYLVDLLECFLVWLCYHLRLVVDADGFYLGNQIRKESILQVTWEDNGRDYICYSNVEDTNNQEIYSGNCTQTVTVLRKYNWDRSFLRVYYPFWKRFTLPDLRGRGTSPSPIYFIFIVIFPVRIHTSISSPDPAKNFTIIPDKGPYYHGETITVLVESNPEPNQIQWTHLNSDTVGFCKSG